MKFVVPNTLLYQGQDVSSKEFFTALRENAVLTDNSDTDERANIFVVTYIRTTNTDKVLCEDQSLFYDGCIPDLKENGSFIDALNEATRMCSCTGFDNEKMNDVANLKRWNMNDFHSFPVGAFCLQDVAYIVQNMIVPDDFDLYRSGLSMRPIQDLKTGDDPIVTALLPTLVLVKKGEDSHA